MTFKTADLVDAHDADLTFCDLPFLRFGRRRAFAGAMVTVKCFEDNALLKATLQEPGRGRVLAVDGGGSTRCALMGDVIAEIMRSNGWAGAVIHGAIRDCEDIDAMDVGLRCLSTSPKKSGKDGFGHRDVELRFGGAVFRPGEWLYCDADGVLLSRDKLL